MGVQVYGTNPGLGQGELLLDVKRCREAVDDGGQGQGLFVFEKWLGTFRELFHPSSIASCSPACDPGFIGRLQSKVWSVPYFRDSASQSFRPSITHDANGGQSVTLMSPSTYFYSLAVVESLSAEHLEAIAGLDSGYRTAPGWDPTNAP